MALINWKNFSKGTLSGTHDASQTTIDLVAGHGTRFPSAPFRAVIWNSTDFQDPSDAGNSSEAEIVEVGSDPTANQFSGVERGVEGTTAITHDTAGKTYSVMCCLTSEVMAGIPQTDFSDDRIEMANVGGGLFVEDTGEVSVGMTPNSPPAGRALFVSDDAEINGFLYLDRGPALAIASNEITLTRSYQRITGPGTVNNILPGNDGLFAIVRAVNGTVTIEHNNGNIRTNSSADAVLGAGDVLFMINDSGNWLCEA